MHSIKIDENHIRTDLLLEEKPNFYDSFYSKNNIKVYRSKFNKYNYTTISFLDITDKDEYNDLEDIFINEINNFLNLNDNDIVLIVGLGNDKSTPDSLGPLVVDEVIATRYLYLISDVDCNFSNVSKIAPNVMGNTGIDSINIIKSIISDIHATKVIVIDSLKSSSVDRLLHTIQITDSGIHPGSGINNDRGELSSNTVSSSVISIGVPTVVDVKTIVEDLIEEKVQMKNNFIVTPTNIDFLIEKLSKLIGEGINISLHKDFIRQKK